MKERGAMNAFGLFSSIRKRVDGREDLKQPLLAVISCSADEKAARAAGRTFRRLLDLCSRVCDLLWSANRWLCHSSFN